MNDMTSGDFILWTARRKPARRKGVLKKWPLTMPGNGAFTRRCQAGFAEPGTILKNI
jgi:hypothetical protein